MHGQAPSPRSLPTRSLTANNFVRVTGPIVFGAVGSAFGLGAVFWIVAAIMAAGGLLSRRSRAAR